jgi:hypothetical protein
MKQSQSTKKETLKEVTNMQNKSFVISEEGHVVNILPPISLSGGSDTHLYSFSMARYTHASILVSLGAAVGTSTITIKECTSHTGSGAKAIPFNVYKCDIARGDTLSSRVACDSAGFSALGATGNVMYVVELESSQLDDGYPYVALYYTDPSGAQLGCAVAVLSGARYEQQSSVSALT